MIEERYNSKGVGYNKSESTDETASRIQIQY